jgi:hypothetical protein
MKHKIRSCQSLKLFFNKGKRHFNNTRLLIWLNLLAIATLSGLSIYAKFRSKGQGVENLFSDPFTINTYYWGWLTAVSEILWCVAIAVCLFTISLIPQLNRRSQGFLLVSSILMSLLYFDDRFRLTLILTSFFGTYIKVKAVVYSVYGTILILYGRLFWQKIKKTPYFPLLIAFFLFAFSSVVDLTPMISPGAHAMLEDGTKLVGLINLTLYFWYVCRSEVSQYLKR